MARAYCHERTPAVWKKWTAGSLIGGCGRELFSIHDRGPGLHDVFLARRRELRRVDSVPKSKRCSTRDLEELILLFPTQVLGADRARKQAPACGIRELVEELVGRLIV